MCATIGIERGDIDRFCCHPGGVKVIDAIETALELNQGELNLEREVLRDYGNMSAPTVLFVLERLLEQGLPDKVMMTAFGPGFTCAGTAARSGVIAQHRRPRPRHAAAARSSCGCRSAQHAPPACSGAAMRSRAAIIR